MNRVSWSSSALLLVWLLMPALLAAAPPEDHTVSVLYAASLKAAMANTIGPAFTRATGYGFQGEAQGSLGGARMIRDHQRHPDVFVSADPLVYPAVLMGPQNGNHVKWFITLGSSEMVIGYNPRGKFAMKFREAEAGKIPWYEALATVGVRFGRADPTIDPKGYRTLFMFHLAAQFYHRPELWTLLGDPMNPEQAFPEVGLVDKVESGQLDAGIFYKHEMIASKLPFVALPKEINLGDTHLADLYGHETFVTSWGEHVHGAPIIFTITIPDSVTQYEAAIAFVRFLLTSDDLWKQLGFRVMDHQVEGDSGQVPAELRRFTGGTLRP